MTFTWDRVQALQGKTLQTVSRGATFKVEKVNNDHVWVMPCSSGKLRRIERWRFEEAERQGLVTPNVTPTEIRKKGISDFNPAYVAAIIRAVVGTN